MAYATGASSPFVGTGTLTATAPSGVASGDRLIALLTQDGAAATITPPSGWTEIGNADNFAPDSQTVRAFEKIATGADSYAFTSSATSDALMHVLRFTGRHASTASTCQVTTNSTANATPVSVSLTGVTAATGDDLVAYVATDQSAFSAIWSCSTPPGFTTRFNNDNGNICCAASHTKDNASSGATGAITATYTRTSGAGTAGYDGFVIAIPQGAGGGGGNVLMGQCCT